MDDEQERPASDAVKAAAAAAEAERALDEEPEPTPAEEQVRKLGAAEAHQRSA